MRKLVFGQRGRRRADLVADVALVLAWGRRVRLHVVLELPSRLAGLVAVGAEQAHRPVAAGLAGRRRILQRLAGVFQTRVVQACWGLSGWLGRGGRGCGSWWVGSGGLVTYFWNWSMV